MFLSHWLKTSSYDGFIGQNVKSKKIEGKNTQSGEREMERVGLLLCNSVGLQQGSYSTHLIFQSLISCARSVASMDQVIRGQANINCECASFESSVREG